MRPDGMGSLAPRLQRSELEEDLATAAMDGLKQKWVGYRVFIDWDARGHKDMRPLWHMNCASGGVVVGVDDDLLAGILLLVQLDTPRREPVRVRPKLCELSPVGRLLDEYRHSGDSWDY